MNDFISILSKKIIEYIKNRYSKEHSPPPESARALSDPRLVIEYTVVKKFSAISGVLPSVSPFP